MINTTQLVPLGYDFPAPHSGVNSLSLADSYVEFRKDDEASGLDVEECN